MDTELSGSVIFTVAMQMEQSSKDFYEALAQSSDMPEVHDFCVRAAGEEGRHWSIFGQLQERWEVLHPSAPSDPQTVQALLDLARQHIQPKPEDVHKVAINGTLEDAISMAGQIEQDSIDFYEKILALLPGQADSLRGIIAQERKHLRKVHALRLKMNRHVE